MVSLSASFHVPKSSRSARPRTNGGQRSGYREFYRPQAFQRRRSPLNADSERPLSRLGTSERDHEVVFVDDDEFEGGVAEAGAQVGAFFAGGTGDVGGAEAG